MKRKTFSFLAVVGLAFAGGACERHPAHESDEAPHGSAPEHHLPSASGAHPSKEAAPHAPETVPTNAAGAGPISATPAPEAERKVLPAPGSTPAPAAPPAKFFPDSK